MDLSTSYLGLALRNPLVASASPLSNTLDGVKRLADAGVGAVVLYSLFEEQLRREAEQNARLAEAGTESFGEALSYFPAAADSDPGGRLGTAGPIYCVADRGGSSICTEAVIPATRTTPSGTRSI